MLRSSYDYQCFRLAGSRNLFRKMLLFPTFSSPIDDSASYTLMPNKLVVLLKLYLKRMLVLFGHKDTYFQRWIGIELPVASPPLPQSCVLLPKLWNYIFLPKLWNYVFPLQPWNYVFPPKSWNYVFSSKIANYIFHQNCKILISRQNRVFSPKL